MALSERRQQARFGIDAMLEGARQLYAQHFWGTQRADSPIAEGVLKLLQSLVRLKEHDEFDMMVDTREETFVRLTNGLSETIDELDAKFGNTSTDSNDNIDTQTRAEASSLWIQGCQKKISYFVNTVDIIVETLGRSVVSQMWIMVVYPLIRFDE
jgi:predicted DNA-binding antitoxin AbrB/MazE fold protein